MRRAPARAASALLLALALVACGGDSQPAVCTSLDNLNESVNSLQDIDVGEGALADLQATLADIQAQLRQLKTEAESEFSAEIDQLDEAVKSTKSSLTSAGADASASSLAAVGLAVGEVGSAASALQQAVSDTC